MQETYPDQGHLPGCVDHILKVIELLESFVELLPLVLLLLHGEVVDNSKLLQTLLEAVTFLLDF